MANATMHFPSDFLWGTATASYQVEGNNINSDWWAWEQETGRILDGGRSGRACDWWENAERDLDLAAEMGTNAHRFSLEWSRIEPSDGQFDEAAIARYRDILQAMHGRGIEPMVTLHHFSNPIWFVERGDFTNPDCVELFQRYVAKVVAELGDLIPKWVTINEPMVYLLMRYRHGVFPAPAKSGYRPLRQAMLQLLTCHAAAYHTIKEAYPDALVGVAKAMPDYQKAPGGTFLDSLWAKRVGKWFNEAWMQSMVSGRAHFPSQQPASKAAVPHLKDSFDFVGVNYYTRHLMRFLRRRAKPPAGAQVGDGAFGEVYAPGLYHAIKYANRLRKPIYITESGVPDREDVIRPGYLITHLREVWRALSFCFPVMGYYHWTLVDNFEWDRGWTQRFGLIALDEETGERTMRASGRLYGEICQANAVSSGMAERYAPKVLETLFPG